MKKQVILRNGETAQGKPLTKRSAGKVAIEVKGTNGRKKKRIIPLSWVAELKDLPGTQPV